MNIRNRTKGRRVARDPKEVIVNFAITRGTAKQLDDFINVSGFNTRSEFIREFITSAVSADEKQIMKFFQIIIERATKQLLLKTITGKSLKR